MQHTCLLSSKSIQSIASVCPICLLKVLVDLQGTVIQGSIQRDTANQVDGEIAEHYWFPMLAGLSDLTSDPRTEVRNCALEVLFDLLKVRGQSFSGSFWESVYHRVLFPIFDFVRSVSKDGEKPASQDQWIQDTCIHSLQLLCDLFSAFYKVPIKTFDHQLLWTTGLGSFEKFSLLLFWHLWDPLCILSLLLKK